MNIQTEYEKVGKPYQPIFPAEAVSGLDRQETMDVLLEVEKIARTLEDCEVEIAELGEKIKAEQAAAEALRNKLSKPVSRKIWIITIIGAVIGTFIIPVLLTIVFGVVAYFIAFAKIGNPYLIEHQEENDIAADTHIRECVVPLQNRLNALQEIKKDIMGNGRRAWAIEVVGENLFYSACTSDLYDLVKSRRADNLKEALNKYDDEQYKARMQEIQEATQRAAERSAEEAKKQTGQLKSLRWNTAWTAWNTSRIKRNTRRR